MNNPASRRYDAIFFDAGYTLLEPTASPLDRYLEIAKVHGGRELDRDEFLAILRKYWEEHPPPGENAEQRALESDDASYEDWWRGRYTVVFEHLEVPADAMPEATAEMYTSFHTPELWKPYPDTVEVLKALQERELVLGICSNWSSGLQAVIDGLDLRQYFAFVHTSAEVGELKPGHRMFEHGLRDTGTDPNRVLHVGDTWDADVIGAGRAGIQGVLINRWDRVPDGAELVIDELSELLALLD